MAIWLILAVMTIAALVAVLWPLTRARQASAGATDIAVYRDQLEEIERDRADGRIGLDEFEAARVEVSRRLLAAASAGGNKPPTASTAKRRRVMALTGALVLIPLLSFPLYALLGSPGLPGEPLAARNGGDPSTSVAAMIARIEDHLEQNPNDGEGWEVLAPVYMRLDRYDDAVKARRNALKLLGETAERQTDLGEALTAAVNGVVTEEAKQAFDRAVALDADSYKALFYLGLAAEQDGKPSEAARQWRELIGKAPADAPWVTVVRQSIARVEGTPEPPAAPAAAAATAPRAAPPGPAQLGPAQPGPTAEDVAASAQMTPQQRDAMIHGMIDRLAASLHEDGSNVDGWLRLLRAYMVLGERDKAKAAVDEARGALVHDPQKLRVLEDAVKGLGIEG
jgi:cytochrome c-type biogenesis protein CcmH